MRALTLIRPMSAAIVHGTKRVENRPRPLPKWMEGNRTLVAVHAGAGWDRGYEQLCGYIDGVGFYGERFADTGIVGAMILTGRVFTEDFKPTFGARPGEYTNPWWSGPYGYEIEWAAPLETPIPAKGMLGFWTVPEQIAISCWNLAVRAGVSRDLILEPPT